MISLIKYCGTGMDASTVVPFKSEKLLSMIFWKIVSIEINSSRFYLGMQFLPHICFPIREERERRIHPPDRAIKSENKNGLTDTVFLRLVQDRFILPTDVVSFGVMNFLLHSPFDHIWLSLRIPPNVG